MKHEDYASLFQTLSDAIEFENHALSIGTEFLPACAVAVRDGDDATETYWAWLSEQAQTES